MVCGLALMAALAGPPARAADEDLRGALAARLEGVAAADSGLTVRGVPLAETARLVAFYRNRGFAPLWIRDGRLLPQAAQLLHLIRTADAEGLVPEHYHPDAIEQALAREGGTADTALLAEDEMILSDALLRYAGDMLEGRLRDSPLFRGRTEPEALDLSSIVADGFASGLAGLPQRLAPQASAYARLRGALARYRELEHLETRFAPPARTLQLGDHDDDVAMLRQRLRFLGDLPDDGREGPVFDGDLAAAVRRFQARHGLDTDGVVGPKTWHALAVPMAERVAEIEFNLERWRWLPRVLPERYVLVNIAGFSLEAIEGDRPVLSMRAIVGKPYQQTPVFSSRITQAILNPYWQVPHSIATKEMLPTLRRDPGYLARENLRVFLGSTEVDPDAVDWRQVSRAGFPYRFRQDPGPDNALGRIKFYLPNRYSVFLHDTPAKSLFRRNQRSFSHGCIRLEKPFDLALFLLADQPQWSRERIDAMLERTQNHAIDLAAPVPTYVVYWTAWVDAQGRVNFRPDLYRRDLQMRAAFEFQ